MKISDAASLFCASPPPPCRGVCIRQDMRSKAVPPPVHPGRSRPCPQGVPTGAAKRRAAAFRDDRARTTRIGRTVPRFAPCASAHGTAFPEWSENFANLPGIPKVFLLLLTAAAGSLKNTGKSQGGVQVPTGGEPRFGAARGRVFKGKAQIRCKSGADGNSPEERERIFRLSLLKHSPLS